MTDQNSKQKATSQSLTIKPDMAQIELIYLRRQLEEFYAASRFQIHLADYQKRMSTRILRACIAGGNNEIPLLWARRTGKTEMLVQTSIVLGIFWVKLLHQAYSVGLINPARNEQGVAVTRERLKDRLEVIDPWLNAEGIEQFLDKGRKTEDYVLRDAESGAECRYRCISADTSAHVKGAGFNLSILEQAEEMDEVKMKSEIFQMATGAEMEQTRVLAGTCSLMVTNRYYYDATQGLEYPNFVDWRMAAKHRPSYGLYVQKEAERIRIESDEFLTQYGCKWITPRTSLIERAELLALATSYTAADRNIRFAGTDIAKDVDSTVVTVVERNGENLIVVDWLELEGVDYEDQANKIAAFTDRWHVALNAIGTQGPGNVVADMLEKPGSARILGLKETPQSNNTMYVEYERELKQHRFMYVGHVEGESAERTRCRRRFIEQHTDVRRVITNNLLSLKAPPRAGMHDDYCASAALALYGANQYRPIGTGLIFPVRFRRHE